MDAPRAPAAMTSLTRARLWLSYQRYALLVSIGSVGAVAAALATMPAAWWLWGPLVVLCLPAFALAHHINRGFRAKMVTTHRGLRQIRLGTFEPGSVQRLCGDPCSRLVASELVARHGQLSWSERRTLISKLTVLEQEASKTLLIMDRTNGKIYRWHDGEITSQTIGNETKPPVLTNRVISEEAE